MHSLKHNRLLGIPNWVFSPPNTTDFLVSQTGFSLLQNQFMLSSAGKGGGGAVASWLVSGPGSSPRRGQCVVFLGKTLYSHSASLHPGV